MKKVLIAMSVACVSVCAALADSSSAYESLKFRTNAWFSLTKDNMASPVGGSITDGILTPVGDKLAFNDAVVFTATEERTNDITTVTLDVVASVVPSDEKKSPNAGIAVALCETSAGVTNFIAWLGADWMILTADAIPGIGESYKLVVRFDNRSNAKKVKFAAVIDDTEYVLKDAGDNEWLTYASSVGKQLHVGFLGDGALTRFDGDQLVILAEAIIAGGEIVDVKEADVKAFAKELKEGETLASYMAANAAGRYNETKKTKLADNLTVSQAYALGLITSQNGNVSFPNNGALEIKADAVAANANGDIKVGFIDVVPNTESGATFSYKVYASEDGTKWGSEPVATYTSLDAVVIPHGALSGGKFFKVVTEVTLKDAQQ